MSRIIIRFSKQDKLVEYTNIPHCILYSTSRADVSTKCDLLNDRISTLHVIARIACRVLAYDTNPSVGPQVTVTPGT